MAVDAKYRRMATGVKLSDDLLRMFRALGDETRVRLLQRLRDGEQCVCDLTDLLGTRQSLLSFHLRTLKEAGLVTDRRDGRWVYYALNPAALETLHRMLDDLKPALPGLRVARRCD
jgi:ArsR family transcriptional regulator